MRTHSMGDGRIVFPGRGGVLVRGARVDLKTRKQQLKRSVGRKVKILCYIKGLTSRKNLKYFLKELKFITICSVRKAD